MNTRTHGELANFIWGIYNLLASLDKADRLDQFAGDVAQGLVAEDLDGAVVRAESVVNANSSSERPSSSPRSLGCACPPLRSLAGAESAMRHHRAARFGQDLPTPGWPGVPTLSTLAMDTCLVGGAEAQTHGGYSVRWSGRPHGAWRGRPREPSPPWVS